MELENKVKKILRKSNKITLGKNLDILEGCLGLTSPRLQDFLCMVHY